MSSARDADGTCQSHAARQRRRFAYDRQDPHLSAGCRLGNGDHECGLPRAACVREELMSKRDRWIILGGGASGLAAAFFLRKYDIDSEIVEKQNTIGGRMGTVMLGDRSLDCGGKNIGKRYKLFRDFAMALGPHEFEHFGLNSSQARDGRLVTFDAKHRWRTMLGLARKTSPQDM